MEVVLDLNSADFHKEREFITSHNLVIKKGIPFGDGVPPENYRSWLKQYPSASGLEQTINASAHIADLTVPLLVLQRCVSAAKLIERYFSQEIAQLAAVHHILLPWVRSAFDDDRANALQDAFRSFEPKMLVY
jgi:hypothetical protein